MLNCWQYIFTPPATSASVNFLCYALHSVLKRKLFTLKPKMDWCTYCHGLSITWESCIKVAALAGKEGDGMSWQISPLFYSGLGASWLVQPPHTDTKLQDNYNPHSGAVVSWARLLVESRRSRAGLLWYQWQVTWMRSEATVTWYQWPLAQLGEL
jgi:hypothetical protein